MHFTCIEGNLLELIEHKGNEKKLSCKSNQTQTVGQERTAFEYSVFSMVGGCWNSECLTKFCEIKEIQKRNQSETAVYSVVVLYSDSVCYVLYGMWWKGVDV